LKISVITACYNSADTIGDTLQSVISQDYAEIEYIIIDGASKDNTLEVVNRYKDRIAKIVSEKDNGIYFALNKGIQLATGDIVCILHADDIFAHPSILSNIAGRFQNSGAECVYGDLVYVDRNDTNRVTRNWRSGIYKPGMFRKGWMPPHPAFFLRKEVYNRFGTFDTTFKTAADYELMLRMLEKHGVSVAYLPEIIVKMRVGGMSNVSLKNRIRANKEDRRAWKVNGLKPGLFTLIRKPLSKLRQFFA
jgi:glycosyltransferase involved in cell wall biosynthesis